LGWKHNTILKRLNEVDKDVIERKADQRDGQMAHDEGSDQPGRPVCGHTI
jgi:hypothetical protein